ncbi:MAG: Holliday junction branch migration DNA helicase RuvB [Vigna little leaf phytoplasma]|nr:Holliday junction branch migration DNA helicase RuvB [Vigna little leaf phytoplasma]
MDKKKINKENKIQLKEEEQFLRPQTLNQYLGQDHLKKILKIYLKAAQQRKETLDHLLFYGPPGLGKTTLAKIIANELKVGFKMISAAHIEKIGDLTIILSNLKKGDVLFIDEIHSLPRNVEEILYSVMEDYFLDIIIGKNEEKRTIRINLPPFSLVGATTKFGNITFPLRDRFGLILKLNYYTIDELNAIIERTAQVYGSQIEKKAILELARRSRGTPRLANRLFRRTRDFAEIFSNKIITHEIALETLDQLKIDNNGLNETDYHYLINLVYKFHNGPVGIKNLATTIGEEIFTIEEVYEPYLIKEGYIKRTARGRIATPLAQELLKQKKIYFK